MKNQIVCPNCKKTISNNIVIDDAAKGTGLDTQYVMCKCGERITYWQITAQLRDQKPINLKTRFQHWMRDLFPNR